MRSFNLRTSLAITGLAVSVLAAPLGSAYAAQSTENDGVMDASPSAHFQGMRIDSIISQLNGIHQGIADAKQAKTLTPEKAAELEKHAADISKAAEKMASANHDRLPATQYKQLMHRVDKLNERLLNDTARESTMGDSNS